MEKTIRGWVVGSIMLPVGHLYYVPITPHQGKQILKLVEEALYTAPPFREDSTERRIAPMRKDRAQQLIKNGREFQAGFQELIEKFSKPIPKKFPVEECPHSYVQEICRFMDGGREMRCAAYDGAPENLCGEIYRICFHGVNCTKRPSLTHPCILCGTEEDKARIRWDIERSFFHRQ